MGANIHIGGKDDTTLHFIGIDPGVSGGIAWTSPLGDQCKPMPATLHDTIDLLESILDQQADGKTVVYIEELPKYVGPIPSSAVFVMARNYGQLEGALATMDVSIRHVKPQAWQKALGLGTSKGGSKSDWKNKLKAKAQHLFPEEEVTLKTADALLILNAAQQGLI